MTVRVPYACSKCGKDNDHLYRSILNGNPVCMECLNEEKEPTEEI